MTKQVAPCFGCNNRRVVDGMTCHATCKLYQQYREAIAAEKKSALAMSDVCNSAYHNALNHGVFRKKKYKKGKGNC